MLLKKNWITTSVAILLAAGCLKKPDSTADLKVTNGIVATSTEFKNVVEIDGLVLVNGNLLSSYCTGTFLSKRVLLTAAHCAYGNETTGIETQERVYFNGKAAELYITHPYKQWDNSHSSKIDMAIAVFKDDTAPSNSFNKVTLEKVTKDDPITIAGFGVNDATDSSHLSSGIKRYGHNVVHETRKGEIIVKGVIAGANADGKKSATGIGDSGGPIFNKNDEIIGVTSSGRIAGGEKYSVFTAMDSDFSRKLLCVALEQNIDIPGFPASECTNFPAHKTCDYKYNSNHVLSNIECD